MSFFIDLLNGAKSLIWNDTSGASSAPIDLEEVFRENLVNFSAVSIDQEECIANCVKSVEKVLQPEDCDLSEASQKVIESHLENFNTAVDETPYLTDTEIKLLKSAFRKTLCEVVEQKWAALMATSFYPIPSFSFKEEKIAAAQKWAHEFMLGVEYFNKWEGLYTSIHSDFVAQLQRKTVSAFRTYSNEVTINKMKTMQAQMEKDPIAFAKRMEEVEVKVDGSPTSESIIDSECDEFAQILAESVTGYSGNDEKKVKQLSKCIWHGYTLLQLSGESILDSNMSQHLFAHVF